MRIHEYKSTNANAVLAEMVMSTELLGRVVPHWDGRAFASPWQNQLAEWCVVHYRKHKKAPRRGIRTYYDTWAEHAPQAELEAADRFLQPLLDKNRDKLDPGLAVDLAAEEWTRVRLNNLRDRLESYLDSGHVAKADEAVASYRKVEVGVGTGTDPFLDEEARRNVFAENRLESLFDYEGDLGVFFARHFARNCFVALVAGEKSGKSFWLLDIAYRARRNRCKVVYFDVGDMTEEQVDERLLIRDSGHPHYSPDGKWPYTVRLPKKIVPAVPPADPEIEWDSLTFKKPLDATIASEAAFASQQAMRTNKSYFKRVCFSAGSASAQTLRLVLDEYARDNYHADVVCIAKGSMVLTSRGLVAIENVKNTDKLWDGSSWVNHGGLVYKGVQNVINYAGLTATPEHKVWTEEGWRTIESCRQLGLRIAQTGAGRRNLWIGESYISDSASTQEQIQKIRYDLYRTNGVCLCSLYPMWFREMDNVQQLEKGNSQGMSGLYAAKKISYMVMAEAGGCSSKMPKPTEFQLEALWRQGNRISIFNSYRGVSLGTKEPWIGSFVRNRQNRQQWTLRAEQSSFIHASTKLCPHSQISSDYKNASIPAGLSICNLCRCNNNAVFQRRNDSGSNCRALEKVRAPLQAPVYDIVNAGPFHRFTVQGLLVHNCIDYPDLLAPIDKREDRRNQSDTTWKALRAISQDYHCLVVVATQANRESYTARTVKKHHISEDKRKGSHVTSLFTLSATEEEKGLQLCRLNCEFWRNGQPKPMVYVGQCLALAQPAVTSAFVRGKGKQGRED